MGPPTNPPTKAPATGKAAAFHLLAYKNTGNTKYTNKPAVRILFFVDES